MIAIKSQHQAFLDFIRTVLRCDPSREASLAEGCMLLSVFSWVHYKTAQKDVSFSQETIKRSAFRLEATRTEALSPAERQQLEKFARQISRDEDVLDLFCQLSPWALGNVRQIYDWCCQSRDHVANRFAGLVLLLRCYDACCRIDGFIGGFSEIPQKDRAKLEQGWRRFELKEEELKFCWDCLVWISLKPLYVKISAEVQRCIGAYQERRLPRRLLLSDFAKVVVRDKDWNSPYNPWQSAYGQEGYPVESGLTVHETAFNFAAMKLEKEKPTNVIAALFYPPKRNDMALEQWVLWNFLGHPYNQPYMPLIINPSPHTLAIWHEEESAGHFVVRDETLKRLYEHQFPNSLFVTFGELADLFQTFSYDDVLLLARDMGEEELRQVLEQLSTMHPQDVGRMELMLPCSYLDAEQKKGYLKIITRNASLRHILLLPSAVSRVAPRKKALLYLDFQGPGEPEDVVGLQEAVSIRNGRLMRVIPRHYDVTLGELLAGENTLKELARQKKKPPAARAELRHRTEKFAFSQEIVLRYIFLEDHHGKAAARAYYCASTHGQPGRKTKGKCLSDRIEKGLRGDNREEVLARLALLPLNNPGLGDIIVRDIQSAYRGELEALTLKTMWFCCRKDLLQRSSYDDEMARTLFCGPEQVLANLRPGEALERDYLAAMEGVLGEPQIRHWQQLDLILDGAQQAGYLRRNRVHEMMSSLSRQLSQEAQNVRSNLAKKTFFRQEEERILAYFQEKTSVYVKKHRASRYEAEPLVLAAAIRFFTGMSAAEVCALRWSDLVCIHFQGEDLYQLRVERYAREDGSVCSHAARDDWRRYRLIPVVPELIQMMEGRRLFLARQREEDPKLLSGHYMFPRRGRPGDQPAPCRPQDIRNQCSKVLSQVDIAPLKLDLPEEKGRVEIDLNRYYGDQFRANFRLRASDTCGLTGGELAYLLGQAAPDTFSEHYCDFGNGMVQLTMLHKLQRWTTPLVEEFHAPARRREGWLKQRPVTERAKPTKAGAAELELRLEASRTIPAAKSGLRWSTVQALRGTLSSWGRRADMENYLNPKGWIYSIDDQLTFYGALDTYYEECSRRWRAVEIRQQYARDYTERILPALEGHNERPLREFTCEDFERAIERIQQQGRGRAGGKFMEYAESTIQHFRYLMHIVVSVAAQHGVCDDVLWGSQFDLSEHNAVPSGPSRTRQKRSLTMDQEIAVWNLLSDPEQRGEYMGLLLMFALGLRNGEACGANFGDIRPMRGHPEDFVLIVYKSTKIGKNELKVGGKTRNADRMVPVPPRVLEVLARRRARVQAALPEQAVEEQPIACVGSDYGRRAGAHQITAAGRQLFRSIGMDRRQLAYIDVDLAAPHMQDYEKDPSAYLLRRNFGTHLHILGLSEAEIQYVLGHNIEDPHLSRSDFMDEDRLYAIKQKLERRPILNELPEEGQTMEVCQISGEQHQLSDLQECSYLVPMRQGVLRLRLKAREPYEELKVRVSSEGAAEGGKLRMECFSGGYAPALERSTDVIRQYHLSARRALRRAEERRNDTVEEGQLN